MSDTLAALKEENHLSDVTQISQIFAPRYMTRSRVTLPDRDSSTVYEIEEKSVKSEEDFVESLATAPSDRDEEPVMVPVSAVAPIVRKRGRHKEYTAPTGVWKTNGGYISTIYVGNKRIYGPLRENPVEAGFDRQRLIEAKASAMVRNEPEMRSFIQSLKTGGKPFVCNNQLLPITPTTNNKRPRPLLTTIQSGPTTIVPATRL